MFLPKRFTGVAGILFVLVILIAGGVFVFRQFEWYPPRIQVHLEGSTLGRRPFVVRIHDGGTGLAYVSISLVAGGESSPIHFREFESSVESAEIPLELDPARHKLKDGPAVLTITAADRSYWSLFRGNKASFEKNVTMDFRPPSLEVIADDRYVTQGGSGLVTYKVSPDTARSGIKIADYFFPAYRDSAADGDVHLAFFSHPYDVPPSERAMIVAEDHAGNTRHAPLVYNVRPLRYRSVKVEVSDSFIRDKIGPLLTEAGGYGGSPQEQFLKVNDQLRQANEDNIRKTCQGSAPMKLWTGRFTQLPNSAVQANFADRRSYYYREEKIDEARHLGYDLAVTRRYPVAAANGGTVSYAGALGIYGNTVIIDHGFGLCSLYSHLSSVAVAQGDSVKKGARIGRTGETGLAIGDHLHYGVYIQGVAVLPLEWWDAKWIRDNVTGKLSRPKIKNDSPPATSPSQAPAG